MGKVMITLNHALLNQANYEDLGTMKSLLRRYNEHSRGAMRGDSVAHSILIDLKDAICYANLTEKQLETVELHCLHCMTEDAISVKLSVGRSTIQKRFESATKKIQDFLLDKTIKSTDFMPICSRGGFSYD